MRTIFYVTGTIFFIIVIIACAMFIRKTAQTAKHIKKVLTSGELENLILQVRNDLSSSMRRTQ